MTHSLSRHTEAAAGRGLGQLNIGGLEGFSYLLGQPSPNQRSTLCADVEIARPLLKALVNALPAAPSPEAPTSALHPLWSESLAPNQPAVNIDDNPSIPAGYTYLLQFVAHDLIQTVVPFWAAVDSDISSANARGAGLRLDTLYGGGPTVCPIAYETAGDSADDRTLLRLGHVSLGGSSSFPPDACQFRDLGRVNLLYGASSNPDPRNSANFTDANEVLIADRRNDDNIILAQITVLFSLIHNIIARRTGPSYPEAKFLCARAALQHIYYNILSHDLLPRLLHSDIYDIIRQREVGDQQWLWQSPGIPLEFSHGAFRVGHAMVRNRYRLNAAALDKVGIVHIVQGNRSVADAHCPMQASWVIQWSNFFPELGAVPNYSRRIGPTQSRLNHERLFLAREDQDASGISLRDLLSSGLAQMWSVDALIREIQIRNPRLIPESWPFLHPESRARAIRQWLTKISNNSSKPADAILANSVSALSEDLPLPLFILLEAALDPAIKGKCMGVLGSIIVSEVICKRLAEERERLLPKLNSARNVLAEEEFWSQIDGVKSMPDLLRFAARNGVRGDNASLPFI